MEEGQRQPIGSGAVGRALAAAQRVVVLADSSKMEREDFSSFAPLDEVDVLITDDGIDPEFSAALSAHGIEVVIA